MVVPYDPNYPPSRQPREVDAALDQLRGFPRIIFSSRPLVNSGAPFRDSPACLERNSYPSSGRSDVINSGDYPFWHRPEKARFHGCKNPFKVKRPTYLGIVSLLRMWARSGATPRSDLYLVSPSPPIAWM